MGGKKKGRAKRNLIQFCFSFGVKRLEQKGGASGFFQEKSPDGTSTGKNTTHYYESLGKKRKGGGLGLKAAGHRREGGRGTSLPSKSTFLHPPDSKRKGRVSVRCSGESKCPL